MSSSNWDYIEGVFFGSGRLGMFSREANCILKNTSKHGVRQLIAAVADETGPFPGGAHASEIAIEAIISYFRTDYFNDMKPSQEESDIEQSIQSLLGDISHNIYSRGKAEGAQIRLSLTIVLMINEKLYAAHVGTNRILKVDNKDVCQLTEDHKWSAQAFVQQGRFQNILHRDPIGINTPTLGLEPDVEVQFITDEVKPQEKIILVTDGITEFIPNKEIHVIFNSVETIQGSCNRLIDISKERGMRGNATIVSFSLLKKEESSKKSVSNIIKNVEERKRKVWNLIYAIVVVVLLISVGFGGYMGYKFARMTAINIGLLPKPTVTSTPSPLPTKAVIKSDGEIFYLMKDPKTVPFSFFRLNGNKLNPKKQKYEIINSINNLEFLPKIPKGSYSVSLQINSKLKYRIFEGTSRNQVNLKRDELEIFLTRGASVNMVPDELNGIIDVEIKGLQSPLLIKFRKQNVILKVTLDKK